MPKEQSAGKPTTRRYSDQEKAAAVRMVRSLRAELGTEHGTVHRVATQLGYGVESLRVWVKQADIDEGVTPGVTTDVEFAPRVALRRILGWTLVVLLRHMRQQRESALQQAERDAVRDQRLREMAKRVDNYQQSAVRVGEDVHELRAILAPLPDKLSALEQRDPANLSFAQAAKLVGMGATVDELTQSCGLTQAEAQLMSKLHKS